MASVQLTKTDAWVFMAIGGGPWWASLKNVVTSLDYLNRLMPTDAEFEASIRHLGRAGLVKVSRKGFTHTRRGAGVLKRFGLSTGVIAIMLELMNAWDGAPVDEADPGFEFQLEPGEWERALRDYREWFDKWMANHVK